MTRNESRWEAAEALLVTLRLIERDAIEGVIADEESESMAQAQAIYDAMEARERKQREACADVAINHGSRTGLYEAILNAEAK